MSIEIGDGGLGYIYLGDVLIAGGGGGESGWKPGANTVAYYPLKSDVKDYSGNNKNGTLTGSGTYENNGLTLTNGNYISLPNPGISSGSITISIFMKSNTYAKVNNKHYFKLFGEYYEGTNSRGGFVIGYDVAGGTSASDVKFTSTFASGSSQYDINTSQSSDYYNKWTHLVLTYDGSTYHFYANGVEQGTRTTGINRSSLTTYNWYINYANNMWGCNMSYGDAIIENVYRDSSKVSEVYNLLKSKYGL